MDRSLAAEVALAVRGVGPLEDGVGDELITHECQDHVLVGVDPGHVAVVVAHPVDAGHHLLAVGLVGSAQQSHDGSEVLLAPVGAEPQAGHVGRGGQEQGRGVGHGTSGLCHSDAERSTS